MKKAISFVLAAMLLVSMMPTVFAANATPGTTTLTTTVPGATYTLNIPADQVIQFGETASSIGNVTVTNGENFAAGKNLAVTLNYEAFKSESVTTQIPYKLLAVHFSQTGNNVVNSNAELASGSTLSFSGLSSGSIREQASVDMVTNGTTTSRSVTGLTVKIDSADWSKSLAGDYTSAITFTAEVVVE